MILRPDLAHRLAGRAAERDAAHLRRHLRVVDNAAGTRIVVDGRPLVNFASNDYLGLAQDPGLVAALQDAAATWGVGATAAHLLGGHRTPHAELESEVASWLGYERALLFATGYTANLAVLATLLAEGDLCVQDKWNHACLIDGCRLAGATLKRYRHGELAHAAALLSAQPGVPALIASDAVFSMDGDLAPIAGLAALAREQQALLYLDDAHGFGVLGPEGQGSVAAVGLSAKDVPLLMVTLGKAIGASGALVLGDAATIDGLVQFARPFVFSTATPPAVAAAALAAVRIVRRQPDRRARLFAHVARFRAEATGLGYQLLPSDSAIQPILVGDESAALALSAGLEAEGLYVPAIRHPTVPRGQARLRVTLSAGHGEADLDHLLAALARFPRPPVQD